jgi:hypothetical protein
MYDFEIDEVGFSIWSMYSHALFLDLNQRDAYLQKVYPSITIAADFLCDFKDPKTGLQKRSREDDLMWQSQTSLGAGATLLGLKSAIAAGKIMNESPAVLDKWERRKKELEEAIIKYFWIPSTHQFESAVYGNFGPRGVVLWPAMLVRPDDPMCNGHAEALYSQVHPFFTKHKDAVNKEWWYLGKTTLALAYAWKDDPAKRPLCEDYLRTLLRDVCTQDTRVYGETPMVRETVIQDGAGVRTQKIFENRVGTPCNIAPAYMYLTAEMLFGNAQRMETMFGR